MWNVARWAIAGRQSPGVRAISLEVLGIGNRICAINQRDVAVVVEVRGCIAVMQAVRIEADVRILSEEERSSRTNSYIELNSEIGVPISVVISVGRARPACAIVQSILRLPCPPRVVEIGGQRMRRRGYGQKVSDHHLVESDERM